MEPWHGKEEKEAICKYLDSGGWLMEFKKTREFEKSICDYTGAKFCSVLPNGTVSLFIALTALGIGKEDEVIVPDYTMIASPNAVKLAGARPVFVDIEKENLCMDAAQAEAAITDKTKAVMHVSINGRAGSLDKLIALCKNRGIYLVEDAAQSLGSFYNGKHLGTHGAVGSFSFSAPKVITTGQGGALVTDDESVFKKIKKIKDFGRIADGVDIHDEMGWNFKFTDIQSVIGIEQMKKLAWRANRKKEIYAKYKGLLHGIKEIQFINTDLAEVSPWFIDVLVEDRENLIKYLKENSIGSRPFYPPIHSQSIYAHVEGNFPVTTEITNRGLWLPSSSKLADDEIEYICGKMRCFYGYS